MSDCLHCDINELLDAQLEQDGANLGEVAAKLTECLADLILLVPAAEQSTLMADVLANLGQFLIEKSGAGAEGNEGKPSRSRH